MKIGELAQRTGLALEDPVLRGAGVDRPVQRQANGFREYLPQSAQLLAIIGAAQAGGFSLAEIRHLLPTAGMKKWNSEKLIATLKRKVAEIELLQRRLRQNKAKLLEVIQYAETPRQPRQKHAEHLMKTLAPMVRQRAAKALDVKLPPSDYAARASSWRQS